MKTPKEQVIEYVEKRYQKEKDKWDSGLRNQYFEWEDLEEDLGIDLFRYLSGLKRVLENE